MGVETIDILIIGTLYNLMIYSFFVRIVDGLKSAMTVDLKRSTEEDYERSFGEKIVIEDVLVNNILLPFMAVCSIVGLFGFKFILRAFDLPINYVGMLSYVCIVVIMSDYIRNTEKELERVLSEE